MLIFPQALLSFTVSICSSYTKGRKREGREERRVSGFSVTGGLGISRSRRMGNAVDIVKFQVFFKQSIYCVTLNPWVTLGPHSLRQGVTDHFTIAA